MENEIFILRLETMLRLGYNTLQFPYTFHALSVQKPINYFSLSDRKKQSCFYSNPLRFYVTTSPVFPNDHWNKNEGFTGIILQAATTHSSCFS